MIRLSVPLRQALAKLTLPVLFAVSFGVVLLGKLDVMVADRARISLADALAPIYATLAGPLGGVRAAARDVAGLVALDRENARLRAENARLRHWQAVALTLAGRNRALERVLHWIPSPAPEFVTARVVADAGGVYARALLLSTGPNHFVRKGQIALADGSLIGRITDVGTRSARVLLLTDRNSRVPVLIEGSQTRAVLVGTNGPLPRLIFWTGPAPREGQQVVTAGVAGAFPPDLPVGTVRYTGTHVPEVVPGAALGRLRMVQIVAGGLADLPAPDPTAAAAARSLPQGVKQGVTQGAKQEVNQGTPEAGLPVVPTAAPALASEGEAGPPPLPLPPAMVPPPGVVPAAVPSPAAARLG